MPQFINPFVSIVPKKKFTNEELINAIRQDIAAEEEAVHLYVAHADATSNPLAKKVLKSIADEEKVHAGEFRRLITILTRGKEDSFQIEGAQEVDAMGKRRARITKKAKAKKAIVKR